MFIQFIFQIINKGEQTLCIKDFECSINIYKDPLKIAIWINSSLKSRPNLFKFNT